MATLNPYQVGCQTPTVTASTRVSGDPRLPLRATRVDSGLLNRGILLSGQLRTHLRWNADSSREFIAIDGVRLVSQTAILFSVPQFRFELIGPALGGETRHDVVVDVRVRLGVLVAAFRVLVDGKPVYREGRWSDEL